VLQDLEHENARFLFAVGYALESIVSQPRSIHLSLTLGSFSMRTRRVFTPVLDWMPTRIAPSSAGIAILAPILVGGSVHIAHPKPVTSTGTGMPNLQSMSSTNIAGEPAPPTSINC
jgi:hypothetical protein